VIGGKGGEGDRGEQPDDGTDGAVHGLHGDLAAGGGPRKTMNTATSAHT
jgi:hypothetical protein